MNKEIEELLNDIKFEYNNKEKWVNDMALSKDAWGLLLSYIEQLEKELKEKQEDNYKQSQLLAEKQNKIEQLEKDNKDLDKENQMLFEKNLQLETDYKEANESVMWWTNRYNAIVKQNDDNHKKVVKLENNRDKAIEYIEEKGRLKYNPNELINLLKGGSDE